MENLKNWWYSEAEERYQDRTQIDGNNPVQQKQGKISENMKIVFKISVN